MPVYRKKGNDDTWLEMVNGASGTCRWYVKPTANRGTSSVCFGFLDQDKADLRLPHDAGNMLWNVYNGAAFLAQSMVTATLVDSSVAVPEAMLALLAAKREVLAAAIAEKEAMVWLKS